MYVNSLLCPWKIEGFVARSLVIQQGKHICYVGHQRHFGYFDLGQTVILVTSANSKVLEKFSGIDQNKLFEQRSTFRVGCFELSIYL